MLWFLVPMPFWMCLSILWIFAWLCAAFAGACRSGGYFWSTVCAELHAWFNEVIVEKSCLTGVMLCFGILPFHPCECSVHCSYLYDCGWCGWTHCRLSHCSATVLRPMDDLQRSFLRRVGLTEEVAFLHYNLAPLSLRRDIGMLGFIHRAVLGVASPLICSLFPAAIVVDTEARTRLQQRRHPRQLLERCDGSHCDYMKNSVFGLVGVYNRLPTGLVTHETVSSFQRSLTDVAREACRAQKVSWHSVFSPRVFS